MARKARSTPVTPKSKGRTTTSEHGVTFGSRGYALSPARQRVKVGDNGRREGRASAITDRPPTKRAPRKRS